MEFARLYDEEIWTVYGFFAYRLGSRVEAEDLTQLTFERALRAWHRYDPSRAAERTWLLVIARNLLIDHFRGRRDQQLEPLSERAEAAHTVTTPEVGIDADLANALSCLSDRDREVIALRFGGDLTGPEIAEMLGLSMTNVQQILSRGLRRMRSELSGTDLASTREPSVPPGDVSRIPSD